MKKYFTSFVVLCSLAVIFPTLVSATITKSDLQNVTFGNNRGSAEEAGGGHVTYNLGEGWNLVPLKFLREASGRYHSYSQKGQACEQDIFQNVWYYSPVRKSYYQIPVMADWGAPRTRGNNVLLEEFRRKYYHIYGGSGWVYTSKNCSIEGDSGTQLISENYSDDQQGIGYNYKELVMKAGWNFVPVDLHMVIHEKSIVELFSACSPEKFYKYNKVSNEWLDLTDAAKADSGSTLFVGDIFDTMLVKTRRDCNFADYRTSPISAPPALPN